ncbi:MAG: hypothetical protein O2960_27030 [Verrucomicrobia bacterium]|nr:hypothetical protein [Verrucomicrobiota bacterium]
MAAEFHRRISGDLLPDWADCWQTIAVRVGNLTLELLAFAEGRF